MTIAFVLVVCFLALVMLEALLRALEKLAARLHDDDYSREISALANWFSDPVLGARIAPGAGGHDANGFRNDAVPEKADIVAIGDSQTWGVNAARRDAWPQQLAAKSGLSVYSMALGYFSMAEYWALIDDALGFLPKVVMIGIFPGNDIYPVAEMVHTRDHYASFRSAHGMDLRSCASIQNRIAENECRTARSIDEINRGIGRSFADKGGRVVGDREDGAYARLLAGHVDRFRVIPAALQEHASGVVPSGMWPKSLSPESRLPTSGDGSR